MTKKVVRLNETSLRKMIKETIGNIVNDNGGGDGTNDSGKIREAVDALMDSIGKVNFVKNLEKDIEDDAYTSVFDHNGYNFGISIEINKYPWISDYTPESYDYPGSCEYSGEVEFEIMGIMSADAGDGDFYCENLEMYLTKEQLQRLKDAFYFPQWDWAKDDELTPDDLDDIRYHERKDDGDLYENRLSKIIAETVKKHLKRVLKEYDNFNTGGGENYWERPELDAMFKPGKAEVLYKTKEGMTGGILKDIVPFKSKRQNFGEMNWLIFTYDSGEMGIMLSDDKKTLDMFKHGWPKCPEAYLMSRSGGDWRVVRTGGYAVYKTTQNFDELNEDEEKPALGRKKQRKMFNIHIKQPIQSGFWDEKILEDYYEMCKIITRNLKFYGITEEDFAEDAFLELRARQQILKRKYPNGKKEPEKYNGPSFVPDRFFDPDMGWH